jgi:hypothetical protein
MPPFVLECTCVDAGKVECTICHHYIHHRRQATGWNDLTTVAHDRCRLSRARGRSTTTTEHDATSAVPALSVSPENALASSSGSPPASKRFRSAIAASSISCSSSHSSAVSLPRLRSDPSKRAVIPELRARTNSPENPQLTGTRIAVEYTAPPTPAQEVLQLLRLQRVKSPDLLPPAKISPARQAVMQRNIDLYLSLPRPSRVGISR